MDFKDLQTIHKILSKEKQYNCSIRINDLEEITFSKKEEEPKEEKTIGFKTT